MDDLFGGEAGVGETREDTVYGICRSRNSTVLRRCSRIGATNEELKTRCTRAVRQSDSSSELDQVTRSHKVARKEGSERIHAIVCARILGKVGFDVTENEDRSISSSACECAGF